LIIGSLAEGPGNHRVELSASPVEEVRIMPATRLGSLLPRIVATNAPVARAESASLAEVAGSHESDRKNDESRDFYLHVTDGSPDDARQYARVAAKLVAQGEHVRVYLDAQQAVGELAGELPAEIARLFDHDVLPWCRDNVGAYRDVDGNGKFTVLLSPWLGRLQGGQTSLGGFTREADFRSDLEAPFSNRCDMVYLNSSLHCDAHLRTLLIHEFMHAVCFSERTPNGDRFSGLPPEEDWLNEALAHLAENLNGCGWTNLDYRISRFLNEPHAYPLVIDNYYDCGMWRNHGCRGATYLFLRWCVDQYGDEVLKRLIRSPVNGARNLEWVTGQTFDDLYRRWTVALYRSGKTGRLPAETTSDSQCKPDGSFKSIDLCGMLADWGLAGPRAERWNVDCGARQMEMAGTSSAYLELAANSTSGARRLTIEGDYGTRLQVTLIRLADGLPRLLAEANWSKSSAGGINLASSITGSNQLLTVRTTLDDPNSRIDLIACERNDGETKETYCFAGESLERSRLDARGRMGSRTAQTFELPIPRRTSMAEASGELVLKVVASDERGRRTTSWLTLNEPPLIEQVAARPERSALQ
jgi:hypothetical protein